MITKTQKTFILNNTNLKRTKKSKINDPTIINGINFDTFKTRVIKQTGKNPVEKREEFYKNAFEMKSKELPMTFHKEGHLNIGSFNLYYFRTYLQNGKEIINSSGAIKIIEEFFDKGGDILLLQEYVGKEGQTDKEGGKDDYGDFTKMFSKQNFNKPCHLFEQFINSRKDIMFVTDFPKPSTMYRRQFGNGALIKKTDKFSVISTESIQILNPNTEFMPDGKTPNPYGGKSTGKIREGRGAIVVNIKVNKNSETNTTEQTIMVIGTHYPEYMNNPLYPLFQKKTSTNLVNYINKHNKHNKHSKNGKNGKNSSDACIVMGDFNVNLFNAMPKDIKKLCEKTPFLHFDEKTDPYSPFTNSGFISATKIAAKQNKMFSTVWSLGHVDNIFIRGIKPVALMSYLPMTEIKLHSQNSLTKCVYSDHKFICGSFSI